LQYRAPDTHRKNSGLRIVLPLPPDHAAAMPIEPRPLPCAPAAFVPHLAPEQVERHRQAQQRTLDALDALRDAGDDDAAPDLARLAVEARGALAAHAAQA